jgi:hypothetical protein
VVKGYKYTSAIPQVHHEFCCSLPHREDKGRRKEGQKVIIGEYDEDANAGEIGTVIQEADSE